MDHLIRKIKRKLLVLLLWLSGEAATILIMFRADNGDGTGDPCLFLGGAVCALVIGLFGWVTWRNV